MLDCEGLWIADENCQIPYHEHLYLALHKPAGVECSRSPTHHASVFDFFPQPFLSRGLQPVGRLDADTTGLLILTDDGDLNHRLNAPRKHVMRTYKVEAKHPLVEEQIVRLREGLLLRGEAIPTLPTELRLIDERNFEIGLREGRYHQIKRMLGAVGNRCESIHRFAVGNFILPPTLEPGHWMYMTDEDRSLLELPLGTERHV